MDASVWRHVLADLRADYRCVLPTLPLGSHHRPMRQGADLSLRGLALLVEQFLAHLDLRENVLLDWAERNRSFDRPVLVVWAAQDRLMPREHGGRLAALYPPGTLTVIEDSRTLVPEDQPAALTAAIRGFLADAAVNRRADAS